ncbi:MAG: S24/S26 family peptidase [Candidatus Sericytochromatia bacterium]|nr:S24/S26 family peptidase [Candidatus Sericytochromatia bacterium]
MQERPAGQPSNSLAAAADLITGWITVTTASMVPLIRPHDDVELRLARPHPGDVILVGHAGTLLLHRVLRRDAAGLWLGGDATASWEGPFADQAWPVVVAVRRGGQVQHVSKGLLAYGMAQLLPGWAHRPFVRRVVGKLCRLLSPGQD